MLSRLLSLYNSERIVQIYLGIMDIECDITNEGELVALIAGYHNDKIRENISAIIAQYPRNSPILCRYSALFDNIHLLYYFRDEIGYIADESAVIAAIIADSPRCLMPLANNPNIGYNRVLLKLEITRYGAKRCRDIV